MIKDLKSKQHLLHGKSIDGLYPISLQIKAPPKASCSTPAVYFTCTNTSSLWHNRCNHPSTDVLGKIMKSLSFPMASSSSICNLRQLAKSRRLPCVPSDSSLAAPFDLSFMDVRGPSPVLSKARFRFYLIIVDDFSRYSWLFPLSHKSRVFDIFVKFKAEVELQFSTKINAIQTDEGRGCLNRQFVPLFSKCGIKHRLSCPHTPQQMGSAERKHRHVVEPCLISYWLSSSHLLGRGLSDCSLCHK